MRRRVKICSAHECFGLKPACSSRRSLSIYNISHPIRDHLAVDFPGKFSQLSQSASFPILGMQITAPSFQLQSSTPGCKSRTSTERSPLHLLSSFLAVMSSIPGDFLFFSILIAFLNSSSVKSSVLIVNLRLWTARPDTVKGDASSSKASVTMLSRRGDTLASLLPRWGNIHWSHHLCAPCSSMTYTAPLLHWRYDAPADVISF